MRLNNLLFADMENNNSIKYAFLQGTLSWFHLQYLRAWFLNWTWDTKKPRSLSMGARSTTATFWRNPLHDPVAYRKYRLLSNPDISQAKSLCQMEIVSLESLQSPGDTLAYFKAEKRLNSSLLSSVIAKTKAQYILAK